MSKSPSSSPAPRRPLSRRARRWILATCVVTFMVATTFVIFEDPWPDAHNPPSWRSWQRWVYPLEINAPNRLSLLPKVKFNDMAVTPDGQKLWLVGEHGMIIHSKDGGVTWERQGDKNTIDWTIPSNVGNGIGSPSPKTKTENKKSESPPPQSTQPEPPANKPAAAPPGAKASFKAPVTKVREIGGARVDESRLLAADISARKSVIPQGVVPIDPSLSKPDPKTAPIDSSSGKPDSSPKPTPSPQQTTTPASTSAIATPPSNSEIVAPPSNITPTPAGMPALPNLPLTAAILTTDKATFHSVSFTPDGRTGYTLAIFEPTLVDLPSNTPRYSQLLAILKTTDGGSHWHVSDFIGVPAEVLPEEPPGQIFAGKDGAGWLNARGLPVRAIHGRTDEWFDFPVRVSEKEPEKTSTVTGAVMSFTADGTIGWIVGTAGEAGPGGQWIIDSSDTPPMIRALERTDFRHTERIIAGSDGRSAFIVGSEDGAFYVTHDSAETWQRVEVPKLRMYPNTDDTLTFGRAYCLESPHGDDPPETDPFELLATADAGVNWTSQNKLSMKASKIIVSTDGSAWMLGELATLAKADGPLGEWRCVTRNNIGVEGLEDSVEAAASSFAAPYAKLPAPFYYPLLALIGLIGWRVSGKTREDENPTVEEAIANHYISDKPLAPGQPDALGAQRLALGLSNYIRNRSTGLPLTIAVTGAWGSGKSSVMNLLRESLLTNGMRPVWFNAWHHQNEEHLLAAMLDSIQQQAVPPVWHPDGMMFRTRLAWSRLKSRWFSAALYLAAAAAGVTLVTVNIDVFRNFKLAEDWLGGLGGLAGASALLTTLWRARQALGAFGADPAELLTAASKTARIRDLKGQTSLRYQFAHEFHEVTQAMEPEMRLVIFVDDLDRCRPEQMMTVLENINFLTTSGDCVVVLGMDDDAIKDCLVKQLEWRIELQDGGKELSGEKRREFASLWLEKMVQVSVAVPLVTAENAADLMQAASASQKTPRRRPGHSAPTMISDWVLDHRAAIMKLAAMVCAIAASVVVMVQLPKLPKLPEKPSVFSFTGAVVKPAAASGDYQVVGQLVAQSSGTKSDDPTGPKDGTPTTGSKSVKPAGNTTSGPSSTADSQAADATSETKAGKGSAGDLHKPTVGEARPPDLSMALPKRSFPWWLLFAAPGVYALNYFAWRFIRSRLHPVVDDSPAMREALKAWSAPLLPFLTTPRSLKGFVNKVRFYEMMSRDMGDDSSGATSVAPDLLVAFGALGYCAPQVLTGDGMATTQGLDSGCQDAAEKLINALRGDAALRAHFKMLRQSWKKRSEPAAASDDGAGAKAGSGAAPPAGQMQARPMSEQTT